MSTAVLTQTNFSKCITTILNREKIIRMAKAHIRNLNGLLILPALKRHILFEMLCPYYPQEQLLLFKFLLRCL